MISNNGGIDRICRNFDNTPTIINSEILENCIFSNSIPGLHDAVIDKDFIEDMKSIADSYQISSDFIKVLTEVNNLVNGYFFSSNSDGVSRESAYQNGVVHDEDGMAVGVNMSSLKGKNVAKCSEKSIATYFILSQLLKGKRFKPSLVLSCLKSEGNSGPHAFLLLDCVQNEYPLKHILFDVHNPTLINFDGRETVFAGIYALTDEDYDCVLNGFEFTPTSLYELCYPNCNEVNKNRIYGGKSKEKLNSK